MPHFSTADQAACKASPRLQADFDIQSIPTDVELLQKGCFDDMIRERERVALEESRILSSILHHDSSHYQSQSALSLINNQFLINQSKQLTPGSLNKSKSFALEVAKNIIEAPLTTKVA